MRPGLKQFLYGTPQDVVRQIREYTAGLPVEGIFLWASLAGMPDAMVAAQVRLITDTVRSLLNDPQ